MDSLSESLIQGNRVYTVEAEPARLFGVNIKIRIVNNSPYNPLYHPEDPTSTFEDGKFFWRESHARRFYYRMVDAMNRGELLRTWDDVVQSG